jgi:phytoene dehydrogenase-like protein
LNSRSHYDVVILGAGLSGLAAGVRLAHFGKKVCIFERHNAPGGLNSFYSINGRKFDVGLHAVTNFVPQGVRGTALARVLRQLRIDRGELDLCEQRYSKITFGGKTGVSLNFSNQFSLFESEVANCFPSEVDGLSKLVERIKATDYSPSAPLVSARAVIKEFIHNPLLEDMLLCVPLFYGSAQEGDMSYTQFAMLFQASILEGLARPFDGIRPLIKVLIDKFREGGGERRMKCGVKKLTIKSGKVSALTLDSDEEITADVVLSSIGALETQALLNYTEGSPTHSKQDVELGKISFAETISVYKNQPSELGFSEETALFFNDSEKLDYSEPSDLIDLRCGVICIPNHFNFGSERKMPEGIVKITCLANYSRWAQLSPETYVEAKKVWYDKMLNRALRYYPQCVNETLSMSLVQRDMFTPKTIKRYTGHLNGAIYGSPTKNVAGVTSVGNLYLCGTDQGFLGIIGAMLSGITMANTHILTKGVEA